MHSKSQTKLLVAALALATAPLSAMAGGAHAWSIQSGNSPGVAFEEVVRDWARIDTNTDLRVTAAELETYLLGRQKSTDAAPAAHSDRIELESGIRSDRTLSSTELGMILSRSEGKSGQPLKILVPGTGYTVDASQTTQHTQINKRAMLLDAQEAALKDDAAKKM